MTNIIYRSSDAGAPKTEAISTAEPKGNFIKILKACLLDGYGTRTPVGHWTIAFEDVPNNKLVLRHKSGTQFLRINDNFGSMECRVRGYTSMSDIDTGEGAYPNFTNVPEDSAQVGIRIDNVLSTSRDEWTLIADEEGDFFYYFSLTDGNTDNVGGYFYGALEAKAQAGSPPIFCNCSYLGNFIIVSIEDYLYSTQSNVNSNFGLSRDPVGQTGRKAQNSVLNTFPIIDDDQALTNRYYIGKCPIFTADIPKVLVGYLPTLRLFKQSGMNVVIPNTDRQTLVSCNGVDNWLFQAAGFYYLLPAQKSTG